MGVHIYKITMPTVVTKEIPMAKAHRKGDENEILIDAKGIAGWFPRGVTTIFVRATYKRNTFSILERVRDQGW